MSDRALEFCITPLAGRSIPRLAFRLLVGAFLRDIVKVSISTLIIAGSLCSGCLLLVLGFAMGLWLAHPPRPTSTGEAPPEWGGRHKELSTQMAQTISSALLRVAESLTGQIDAHSTKIEAISSELRAVDHSLAEAKELLGTAPVRLLAANLELQEQLARAKQYIDLQSTQLRRASARLARTC